ncbi:MAG TPA: hypothetical protein VMW95_02270 [Desulfobacterales bacterium]|nr:hypothetical protein [Desulfobacterales bacterium]
MEYSGLMFTQYIIREDNSIEYDAYNRFPLFPFLLTGAATKIGGSNLALQLYLARQVMNLFLLLALLFAYMTLDRLLQHPLLSVSVVLMTFSSHFILYYHDLVFNDIPALLGCTVVLFLIVKSRDGIRLWQAALLAIIAISTGWQAFSVLVVWFLTDLIHVLLNRRKERFRFRIFVRKPSFVALAVGIAWGVTVLGLQLLNEWSHVGGSFAKIPSMLSLLKRTGLGGYDRLSSLPGADWGNFLLTQARRIWLMILPFDVPYSIPISGIIKDIFTQGSVAVNRHINDWRIAAALVGLSGLFLALLVRVGVSIRRSLIDWRIAAVLGLSGLVWALSMRRFVAFHDFQSIFYIGLPLILYLVLFLQSKMLRNAVIATALAIGTTLLFAFCAYQDGIAKSLERIAHEPRFKEFQVITEQLPSGVTVFVDGDHRMMGMAFRELDFYLIDTKRASKAKADFVVSPNRNYNAQRLTNNKLMNLFRNQALH